MLIIATADSEYLALEECAKIRGQKMVYYCFPESYTHPKTLITFASTLIEQSKEHDVICLTFSLFLLRELDMLVLKNTDLKIKYFNFTSEGTFHGATVNDIGKISVLEEELKQSERYLRLNNA